MTEPNFRVTRLLRQSCSLWGLAMVMFGACASPPSQLIIVQNQVPTVDSMSGGCVISTDALVFRGSGVFDVNLDRPYDYFVYPLVQSRLPSIVTSGNIERNRISLRALRVSIKAPVEPGWEAGCPGTFDSPVAGLLDPEQIRAFSARGFQTCHSARMRQLIADGVIPSDLSQPVSFTLELRVIADHNGTELQSDVFPFSVQVCAGCMQAMFPDIPRCADTPKPNPLPGNPCNIAQDGPKVLCCVDPGGGLVCPAPDV
jgi:hypothetical protein